MSLQAKFSALPLDRQKAVLTRGGLLTGRSEHDTKRVKIVEEVLRYPEGIQRPLLLRRAFGHTSTEGKEANTDYQFLTRFLTNHRGYFQFGGGEKEQNRHTGVEPTRDLLDLILQGVRQNIEESGLRGDKEFCRDLLNDVDRLTPDIQEFLADALVRYVERTRDYCIMFELLGGQDQSLYYKLPYRTRFNSRERAAKGLARYHDTLTRAAEEYETAVMVTLTTDPSKFDSLGESIEALMDNFNRLNSWMAYNPTTVDTSRPGKRLQYIKVFEFTGGSSDSTRPGLPHLHVVYFGVDRREDGMPYLIDKEELSQKWDDLGQGRIVNLRAFEREQQKGGSGEFIYWSGSEGDDREESDEQVTVRGYLSKYLRQLVGLADKADQLESSNVGESGLELSKLALYWVTGRQVWSCSEELRESSQRDAETEVAEEQETETVDVLVRFAGCYRNGDVPRALRENTVELAPLDTERLADGAYRWRMKRKPPTPGDRHQPVAN
jgi:hypothetical protein